MSPKKFHEDHRERSRSNHNEEFIINGPRPSPLNINKDSHAIHKSSSLSGVVQAQAQALNAINKKQQRQQPVIIYTESPKVIHTQARDFMALVQKLTGLSRDDDQEQEKANNKKNPNLEKEEKKPLDSDADVSPIMNPPRNPFLADIPLFTPNSTDFFCSPRPMYRFSHYNSPNTKNPISPSVFEFFKELPEC
ncbi:VQ motif-containing protein 8, chloroplastic [Mangifera indica]|uniref:VQ motif-containing protein 8, chloroplastic n=1 Tax=Mangifera indica TaxID=29780 RepID=UPI001CF95E12|nr:VQ motif-containing protein 8, chloroplastic [Mangifera indica]